MPSIKNITAAMEKKIDLSEFFGEEAFVSIKRMGKYNYTFLLNKNRNGYTSKLFSLVQEWRESNPGTESVPSDVYDKLKSSISPDEAEERLRVESEVDRAYYELSIKKDGHNFTDDECQNIELDGGWFYDQYANLTNAEGRTLNDVMINEIIQLNYKGLQLGEPTASR